jgi:hypothetical protein
MNIAELFKRVSAKTWCGAGSSAPGQPPSSRRRAEAADKKGDSGVDRPSGSAHQLRERADNLAVMECSASLAPRVDSEGSKKIISGGDTLGRITASSRALRS